jgi:hypothetical protein
MSWRKQHASETSKRTVVYYATVNDLWSGDSNDPNGQDNVRTTYLALQPDSCTCDGHGVPDEACHRHAVPRMLQAEVWRAGMLKEIVLSAWSVKRRRSPRSRSPKP